MTSEERNTLKKDIEQVARLQGQTPLKTITALQAAAAKVGDEILLGKFCDLKWDYIKTYHSDRLGRVTIPED